MPEIDPQSDPRLTDALRRMAASSRQGAPAEVGAGLAMAFRRHHTRRRRIRMAGAAGLVACLGLAAGLIFMHGAPQKPSTEQARHETGNTPAKTPDLPKATSPVATTIPPRIEQKRIRPTTTAHPVANRQFLALPGYDPAVPADELHVVRVQLPAAALWQMGAPMSPDGNGRRVLADFVVSQDGTPYAVRLVQ
jgi:hypothetical protein